MTALAAALRAACLLFAASTAVHAAEDFQVRYNLAGSLGGEVFAPPDLQGLTGVIALTRVDIRKVTGADGHALSAMTPGGSVPLPGMPAEWSPTYAPQRVAIHAQGRLMQWNLGLAYLSTARYGGGRLALGLSLPYGTRRQDFAAEGATPALQWQPGVPDQVRAGTQAQFDAAYQSNISAQARGQGGKVHGIGDLELHAGWRHATDSLRVLAGASLVLPTGRYSASPGPDIGTGNFFTFRPAAQVVYLPRPDWALAGRVTLGFNTRNRDNQLRSGNWASVEGAVAYMTRLGPVGVHVVHAQQYQDDRNNTWGPSRYRSTNGGVFLTTRIPPIDTVLTLQFMDTLDSRNAKHGSYAQLRLSKSF